MKRKTNNRPASIFNNLGVMWWTQELVQEVFGYNILEMKKGHIEQVLYQLDFPEDTQVVKVFEKPEDISFRRVSIMVSQKDLPYVRGGCQIPTITPHFKKIGAKARFTGWDV